MLQALQFVLYKLARARFIQSTGLQRINLRLFKSPLWGDIMLAQNKNIYRLKDQTCIELSLLGPQDRNRYLKGFSRISSKTNINRFHTFKTGFTEDELSYLLNIDNIHHLAIGAIDCKKMNTGIGLARYISQANDPARAEVAIIVIDEYQGRGLGKLLYLKLIDKALENGITSFNNIIMKDNRTMLHMLEQMGAQQISENEQVYELELQLSSPTEHSDVMPSQRTINKRLLQQDIMNTSIMAI